MRILIVALAVALISGCSTNARDCDPTTGDVSIITKFNCNYSGTWDQRVEDKQHTLQHEQALNKEFKAVYDAISSQQQQVSGQVASKRQSQQALDRSLDRLIAQLKAKSKGKTAAQNQLAELQQTRESLRNSPSASVMQKQLELQKLQNQVKELQETLDAQ